jgi:hypothetical protein
MSGMGFETGGLETVIGDILQSGFLGVKLILDLLLK